MMNRQSPQEAGNAGLFFFENSMRESMHGTPDVGPPVTEHDCSVSG